MKKKFYINEELDYGDIRITIFANEITDIGWTKTDKEVEVYTILVDDHLMSFECPINISEVEKTDSELKDDKEKYFYFFEQKTGSEFIVKAKDIESAKATAILIVNENEDFLLQDFNFMCIHEFTEKQADTSGFDIFY